MVSEWCGEVAGLRSTNAQHPQPGAAHNDPMQGEPPESAQLYFAALGPLEVRAGAQAVDLGPPLRRALLGLLLRAAPHAVTVERLIDELWPAEPPNDPMRNLQVHVAALRKVLAACDGGEALLVTVGKAYRLAVVPDQVDLARFDSSLERARAAYVAGDVIAVETAAQEALCLWRGEAWADLRHLPALDQVAVGLDERRLDAVALRAEALLQQGRHRELAPELEEVVRRNPLREDLVAQLVLALHRSGRQADALAELARLRDTKVEEIGLEPGQGLLDLQQRVLADDPTLLVDDAALRKRRRLPATTTRFFGRESEIGELLTLLREPDTRLVTLTGPGGIGKTRLGLAVAHQLAADFPDGVWFVGLADVRDPALVLQAIAGALEVDEAGDDFLTPLTRHLATRRLLLLLDNFEQVDEAAPVVSGLLESAAGVCALVTSRKRLQVYGEHVRVVEPLEEADAIPLFAARAREVAPWFDAGATEMIAHVCATLDRMPLALELAAARADEISLADMASGLLARLELASYEMRDRTPRQRSLRGAVAWSVDLLAPAEAAAFRKLGVFVGGFEPDAAAQVAGADEGVLTGLARASLLRRDGSGRFRMLETVREYALELLTEDLTEIADAHADWQLRMAEDSLPGMRGPQRAEWFAKLAEERGNMRAALTWLAGRAESGDAAAPELLLRLAAAQGIFWYHTSPGSEDVAWLPRAIDLAPDASALTVGRAHHAMAICQGERGHVAEALRHSREACARLDEADDPAWAARALNTLGGLTRDLARPDEAAPMMDEAIALRRRLADPALPLTLSLVNRAMIALDLDDTPRARVCLEESLAIETDPVERALVLRCLADVALAEAEPGQAANHLRSALEVLRASGQRYRLIECLETMAVLAVHRGEPELTATLLAAADAALVEDESVAVPADVRFRERRTGSALAALAPADLQAARAAGAALPLDAALDLGMRTVADEPGLLGLL